MREDGHAHTEREVCIGRFLFQLLCKQKRKLGKLKLRVILTGVLSLHVQEYTETSFNDRHLQLLQPINANFRFNFRLAPLCASDSLNNYMRSAI